MTPNPHLPSAPACHRYHLWSIGCAMNDADSRHLASLLETEGWRPCDTPEDAQLLILNTCVVRQQAEDKVRSRLVFAEQLKQRNPLLKIALMGCMVGTREAPATRTGLEFPFVDYLTPPSEPQPLLDALRRDFPPAATAVNGEDADARSQGAVKRARRDELQDAGFHIPSHARGTVSAHVPVVLGCSHACTYCVIPYRRGGEHSRPPDEILREARQLVREGVREIVLLGQIVDRYGLDLPMRPSLSGLLRDIASMEGICRVRFLTSHPNYLTDELIETVARTPHLCPHFEVPVQAGSDAVLQRMKRNYTRADYTNLVQRIRRALPDAAIHTDIIVGFPGETMEQFGESVRLVEELRLDKAHIARYSVRPQTYAARRYADDVPEGEKDRRARVLDAAQVRVQTEKNGLLLGKTVEVLVEDRDEKRGRWKGRDPHDRLVFFESAAAGLGHLAPVLVQHTGPFTLIGRDTRVFD